MTKIPSFPSRTVLACALSSAVLVVVSVFWFRKKRKIKELPALGPSEKQKVCGASRNLRAFITRITPRIATDNEQPACCTEISDASTSSALDEHIITSGNRRTGPTSEAEAMQMKDVTPISHADIFAPPVAHHVSAAVKFVQSDVKHDSSHAVEEDLGEVSKASVTESCDVPELLPQESEQHDKKDSNLAEDLCLSTTCCETPVYREVKTDDLNSYVHFADEIKLCDALNETCMISDNVSSVETKEAEEHNDTVTVLSDCNTLENTVLNCRDTGETEQSNLYIVREEILVCNEAVGTAKQLECSLSDVLESSESVNSVECNMTNFIESVNFAESEACFQPALCPDEPSDNEYTDETEQQVSFPNVNVTNSVHECSTGNEFGEEPPKAVELVELRHSESTTKENGEVLKFEDEICDLGSKKPLDCVEDIDVSTTVMKQVDVLNGNDIGSNSYEELIVGSLPDKTIPETESDTVTAHGSIDCSELCTEPLSPVPESIPEDKSRGSVTVSSSVSFSDSAPHSPTLAMDDEFASLDDASKGASTECEKLRTCENTDSSKSNVTNFLPSETFERTQLDSVTVPSKNLVTDLSESPMRVSSPQSDIPPSISNQNLNKEHRSTERQLNASPPHVMNHSEVQSGGSLVGRESGETNAVLDIKPSLNSTSYHIYEFELPQELCGRLIGKQGKYVKYIKERSNSNVLIKRHPFNPQMKLVVVEGTNSDVSNALELIRKKFPPSQFPNVSLAQTHILSSLGVPAVPESSQLHLPDSGMSCDVILSSLVTAGHFFLQQPTHPTYPSLSTLDQCMMACYSQMETPRLPQPVEAGVICAATIMNGWYRAQIVYVFESGEECDIKFVDYGGFSQVPVSSLRQIRSDFMTLPFQASECYLANVVPQNEELGWTPEASAAFEELAQGQILQAVVVSYAEDGVPYVELYRVQGISSTYINQELVDLGVAKWVASR